MNTIVSLASLLCCLVITPLVRQTARRYGWLAHPSGDRWHKKPTALFGGVAIYLGFSIPLLYAADFSTVVAHFARIAKPEQPPSLAAVLWLGVTFLFGLGLIDDIFRIKPQTKLVGQILAASLVTFLGFRLQWSGILTFNTLVTIVWIVGITNALNLIDNMDGLCAGIAAVAAVYLAVLFQGDRPVAAFLSIGFAGTLLGYLFYNFNPASIFMGDCGSLPTGFTLSVLTIVYAMDAKTGGGNAFSAYAVPVMLVMVPILDTTMVTFIRLLSGRKASHGGKDHTSHRLVLMGFSEREAVLFLYGVGAVSGLAALFVDRTDTLTSPAVIIPLAVSVLLMGVYLAQIRVYPEREFSLLRNRSYTPILIELTYKRQILLVILDFCLIVFAYYLSYRLRFEGEAFRYYFRIFLQSLPAVIACKFIAFFASGIYAGIWRYISTEDVFLYMRATVIATLLSVFAVTYIYRFQDFSKGIFLIDWLLTTALILGVRGAFRFFIDFRKRKTVNGRAVLIYGAGQGGEILLREILNNQDRNIRPIGFIDDDPLKTGRRIHGYPILGTARDISELHRKHSFSGLLISFAYRDGKRMETVKAYCNRHHLFLKRFSISLTDVDISE